MKYFIISGVPIKQEEEPSAEHFKKESWSTLSEAEYLAMINPEPEPINELEVAKQSKLNELNAWAYTFVSAGYTDTETGYKLFCGEWDVANYSTLKNAIMDMVDNVTVEIGTMTGWQTSTKGVVYPLLVRYSQYMLPFTTKYMKTSTLIQYAQTLAEVEAITW
jgi:hypothetical protein